MRFNVMIGSVEKKDY